MFNQKLIKDIILEIEQKYPVDKWAVNDVHVWPLIRTKLYIHLLTVMNKKKETAIKSLDVKKETTSRNNIKRVKDLILAPIKLRKFYSGLSTKAIVFYSAHFFRVKQNGKYFNRFYDSIIDFHNLQEDVYMVEYQKIYDSYYNQKAIIRLHNHLIHFKLLNKFKLKFKRQNSASSLEDYNKFYKELEDLKLDLSALNFSKQDIIDWALKIKNNSVFFSKFYRKVKPQKVVFLGYYVNDDLYASLYAANKLGITTIDFQHGPQTNVHLAFSCWTKVPLNSFNTMPIQYWNWDRESKINIDEWAIKTKNVKAIEIGQPYIEYWHEKLKNKEIKKEFIIYSLQTTPFLIEDLLNPTIITTIKKSNYIWILRLHPRNHLAIKDINLYLKQNKIEDKTIIQSSIDASLPEALNSSVLHITNYSGCLIEAQMMGIPTVLIHEVGKEMFQQYIDNKLVYYISINAKDFNAEFDKIVELSTSIQSKRKSRPIFNPLSVV